jgi:hypothetical protein
MLSKKDTQYSRLETTNPLHDGDLDFSIKVYFKDKTHVIEGVNGETTIDALKILITEVVDVPHERQRLIFAGKQLKPDDKTLSFFKVQEGTSIHLFPLPVVTQSVPVVSATSSAPNALNAFSIDHMTPTNTLAHLHDPNVERTSMEVKWWCSLLLFLSAFSIFNAASLLYSTGKLGLGTLDTIVNAFDVGCSIAGVYVAMLGNHSVRTMNLEDIRKYVNNLVMLAMACVAFRVLWVFDMVFLVKKIVNDSQKYADNTNADNNSNGATDTDPSHVALDPKIVSITSLQVTLICMVCIFAWISCLTRALRLRNAVQLSTGSDNGGLRGAQPPLLPV